MIELYLIAGSTAVAIVVLFSILTYVTVRGLRRDSASRADVVELLRREGDTIRAVVEQHSSILRRELGGTLSQFQTGTVASVSALSKEIMERVGGFGERLEASNKTIETRVESIGVKLNDDLARMAADASANRDRQRLLIDTKLNEARDQQAQTAEALRQQLESSFGQLRQRVTDTLVQAGDQQKERLDNAQRALDALKEQHGQTAEQLRGAVEGRLDAIRQENTAKLDEMRRTVDEKLQTTLETRIGESFTRVVEQLALVSKGIGEMQTLANNVGDLKTVLTNPKVRGTFGEVQLALLIEDFLTPDQYVRNAQIKADSGERVEYAIRVRSNAQDEEILLPVDAKFPREDYDHLVAAIHAGDTLLAAKFRKQLETRLKLFARDVKDKYIDPPRTTEFGILFLPTEGLYAEALREPALFDFLRRECCVVLAGPTTFSAILSAFQMNFRSIALARRSSEVWKVLSAVRTEFGRYNDVVTKLGNQLRTAAGSVERLGTRTRAMHRKLRDVEALPDDGTAQRLLGLTEGSDAQDVDDEEAESPEAALEVKSEIVLPTDSRGADSV